MDWICGCVGVLVAVALGSCGLSLATGAASAQQIVVQGANVAPSALKPYFSGTDPASVQRGVEDLKATGVYSNVSARVENGKIVVSLAGGAQIINRGGVRRKPTDREQAARGRGLQSKPHTAYNEATAQGDVGRIKDAYKKYGRNAADVTKRIVQLPNGRVDLVFTVQEGEKTGIRDIKFVGNLRGFELSAAESDADHHDELALVV